jgi:hypothetical protein
LTVSQQFFVMLHIPYSIYVGEILKVDVTVFNYNDKQRSDSIEVDVTLDVDNSEDGDDYDVGIKIEDPNNSYDKTSYTTKIKILKNSQTSTHFFIKAKQSGKGKIRAHVKTGRGKSEKYDQVEKHLIVKNEGLTTHKNEAHLFKPTRDKNDKHHFKLVIDEATADGNSLKMEASVIADLIGPALMTTENYM